VHGKTVTVRQHKAADPEAAQKKRDAFERRVLRERQQAETAQLRERQQAQATYTTPGTRTARTPGERRARKKTGWTRAKSHAKKARRLWRRHKARAAAHGVAAVGWAVGHATRRGAARARKTYRQWRANRKKKR
jgi:ribonuclease HI